MFVFLVVVIAAGWGVSWYLESPIILYVAVFFAVVMNFYSYWYSDKLVVRMTGAKPITQESHPDFWNVVENLSITAGLPMPRVYIVDDPAPNAFATGRDPNHAVVAATTGLLHTLNKTELEGVIAHELSHIGNRDMLVSTVAVVLVGFIAILGDFFLRAIRFGGGRRNRNGKAGAILLVVGILGAILLPVAARLIHFAISRKREFLADASGALLTRYPEGLASALEKISSYSQPMMRKHHATAHLFIANPFGPEAGKFLNRIFSTHPPVGDRIRALRER